MQAALANGGRFSARWRAPRRKSNTTETLSVLRGENGVDNEDEELDTVSSLYRPGSRKRRHSNFLRLDDKFL